VGYSKNELDALLAGYPEEIVQSLERGGIKEEDIMPVLGAFDMECKFCLHRMIDSDSEFHYEQGDAYRGQACAEFQGIRDGKPKPLPVLMGSNCKSFKSDKEAELKYPLWEQLAFVKFCLDEKRWDILEKDANADLEKMWVEWERAFGWRWKYVGLGDDTTYDELKAIAEREEEEVEEPL
jgi:hypothetical protein